MIATRITVDGITYRVLVEYDTLKRAFTIMEGDNTGTAISGRAIRDIIGTTYEYSMTVRADPDYPTDYDSFFYKISEPVDFHSVSLPFGQSTLDFDAKITGGNDIYKGFYAGYKRWDAMDIKFIPMQPQRV